MKALSNPGRLKILKVLQDRPMCVCEIQSVLDISQPAVSSHLAILEAAGLVDRQRKGLWVYYGLSDGSDNPYAAMLLGNLRHWLEDSPDVAVLVEKVHALPKLKLTEAQPGK